MERKYNKWQSEVADLRIRHYDEILTPAFREWVEREAHRQLTGVCALHYSKREDDRWCPYCGGIIANSASTCPHCGSKVNRPRSEYYDTPAKTLKDYAYISQLTTCEGWQIERMWLADYRFSLGSRPELEYLGVAYERWFNPVAGKEVLTGKYVGMFPSRRRIPWALNSYAPLECEVHRTLCLMNRDPYSYYYGAGTNYTSNNAILYPDIKMLRYYRDRKGVSLCRMLRENTSKDCSEILRGLTPKKGKATVGETIFKIGKRREILNYVNHTDEYQQFWKSILVARRHRFDYFKYGGEYFDYLRQLEKLKMDLRNPKYVAPDDFKGAHQSLTERLNRIAERERAERERKWQIERERAEMERLEKAKTADADYRQRRGMYFGIVITNGRYTATPLTSVQEFCDEGIAMHHCVFSGSYYDMKMHPNSLILSVRHADTGEREVTVEVNIKDWKIKQCYAKHDKISTDDKEIREFVNAQMDAFKAVSKKSRGRAVA